MPEKNMDETEAKDSAAMKRQIKYALIASAIVEFVVMALMIYAKVRR
ncbi:MAG: hypothetical protein QOH42_2399 [Blastocatellia bacterium]|jgi:large-conductance mechanosensitive channel|nr:hypothetical protein [Blastocatellia bacterium]